MIGDPCGHRGSYAERLVDSGEVVVHGGIVKFRRQRSDDLGTKQRHVADLFVETARNLADVHLDYSAGSLDQLEAFVDRLWDPEHPPSEAELDNLTKLMGAYLGEVMIRTVDGRWAWDPEGRIPVIETDRGFAFVLDKVYKRQVFGADESLVAFYRNFQARESN